MRIFKILAQISVPDEYSAGDIHDSIRGVVETEMGGDVLSSVISEASEGALPSPEAPTEMP